MALLTIHVLGSPILRTETIPVREVTPELVRLAEDMFDTMHAARGVGLAAPQVGRTERITVVQVEDRQHVLINPEVVEREGEIVWEEGCLSIPDVYGDVTRAARVRVRALGLDGKPFEVEGRELLGVCLQHEIDHLHGRLFIDHLSFLKKRKAMATWEEEKVKYPGLLRVITPGTPDDDSRESERL